MGETFLDDFDKRGDTAGALTLRDRFRASPNAALSRLGQNSDVLVKLKGTTLDLRFTAVDGREVDVQKLRGKVVLIDFWSTWCGGCVEEMPVLRKVYERHVGRDFEIVGVTMEQSPGEREKLLRYLKQSGVSWPQFFDGLGARGEIARRFGIRTIPQHIVLDPAGTVVEVEVEPPGMIKEERLEEIIARYAHIQPGRG